MAFKDPGYSPFIQAVVGDGTTAPDVQILAGWLAPSGEKDYARIYFDASLTTWVDVPRDALLYSEEIAGSYPAGARTVWVRADAAIRTQPMPQAWFGPQQFVGEAPAPTVTLPITTGPLCVPKSVVGCPNPSVDRVCHTLKPALCPSAPNPCPLPTPQPRAFTRFGCPSLPRCF